MVVQSLRGPSLRATETSEKQKPLRRCVQDDKREGALFWRAVKAATAKVTQAVPQARRTYSSRQAVKATAKVTASQDDKRMNPNSIFDRYKAKKCDCAMAQSHLI